MNWFKLPDDWQCYNRTITNENVLNEASTQRIELMTYTSEIEKLTSVASQDTVLLEKVRWSIRQRLRKQMQQLVDDLFDAADDLLFTGGQQGQFGESSNYLNSMRELRAKQKLFEERLIDRALDIIKSAYRPENSSSENSDARQFDAGGDAVLEQVELDLALQAMSRKAMKTYSAIIKQIDSLDRRADDARCTRVFSGQLLIDAVLGAFAGAHSVLSVPLDIRLVFLKLFEQHFLLRMEKLHLDIISIMNNLQDKKFVEKLYSSSSAFHRSATRQSGKSDLQSNSQIAKNEMTSNKAEAVELIVSQLIREFCTKNELPEFVEKMVRTQWREVLFLVGINRSGNSREWDEAKHTLAEVIAAASQATAMPQSDVQLLLDQVRQGFELIQVPAHEQQQFFDKFQELLSAQASASHDEEEDCSKTVIAGSEHDSSSLEASISPTGEQILDQDDLDDLAQLLGCEETNLGTSVQQDLSDVLPLVDELQDQTDIQFMLNGRYQSCQLNRNMSNPSLYTITKGNGKLCLTRSRLGVAIALRSGEMRPAIGKAGQYSNPSTVIELANHTRH